MNEFYTINDIQKLNDEDKIRISKLKIPPNWKNIKINKDFTSKIQVIGTDSKNRTQYIYHPAWILFSKDTKYSKIKSINFSKLYNILNKYSQFNGNISKEYIISNMLIIMKDINIRVGNEKYLEENDSVGLCTLQKKHYKKVKEEYKFIFKGKRGVLHEKLLNKNHIIFLNNIIDLPGNSLFKYVFIDEKNNKLIKKITADDLNQFLKEHIDENMTCKDIRTYCANEIFKKNYNILLKNGYNNKKAKIESIKIVANELGNTVKVCRDSYINPELYE